jgi:membrane-associated phospholipid phosphatase
MLAGALGRPRPLRTLAWGAVAAGVVVPLLRHRLRVPRLAVSAVAWQTPLAVALAMPPSRLRYAALYGAQMWAYFVHYDMPDDDPDALLRRVRVDYPIQADRVLGWGDAPTVRLQRSLGVPGEVHGLDVVLSIVHWSWFAVPHGTIGYVLLRQPRGLPRAAGRMAACFDLGLVFYWTVPTAPPWWAGANGNMAPVRRIMAEAGERVWGRVWRPLYHSVEGNPFAAMPSLHFGTSVMAARVLSEVGRGLGVLGWAYALTLGFGLVYLGEHYVVDLLAGLALAETVNRLTPGVEPLARSLGEMVHRLDAGTR